MHAMLRVLTSALVAVSIGSAAASLDVIAWPDLIDLSAQEFEDPYRDLTYEQLDALGVVVRTRMLMETGAYSEDGLRGAQARIDGAMARLEADGIDVEWLIDQRWVVADRRKAAATAGNPAVDGQEVALTGFVIPAPSRADGTVEVYLVPERGMCSHIPPPNPNQMIRAQLTGDWRPQYIYEPVRLSGQISIDPSEQVFRVVDGPVQMNATFQLNVDQVETIADLRGGAPLPAHGGAGRWSEGLTEKLRGAGALPDAPVETRD